MQGFAFHKYSFPESQRFLTIKRIITWQHLLMISWVH